MKHFTPTLPIRETAKNARAFVRENQDVFWTILKPLLPFIITFELLNIFIDHWIFPDGSKKLNIGSLISSYFIGRIHDLMAPRRHPRARPLRAHESIQAQKK
jgi:hypothetical protein